MEKSFIAWGPYTCSQVLYFQITYGKFGNFCDDFIFANSFTRHICDVKNSRLGHDLLKFISVNDRVISPFCEDFNLTKLQLPLMTFDAGKMYERVIKNR